MQDNKEIDTGIYQLDPKKPIVADVKTKKVYTIIGYHHKLSDGYPILVNHNSLQDELVYAVAETNNDKLTYFIKIDDQGHLFNPLSIGPSQSNKKFKLMAKNKNWQFEKVNEVSFKSYLEFLKTRNVLHLKFAEQSR